MPRSLMSMEVSVSWCFEIGGFYADLGVAVCDRVMQG